MRNRRNIRKTEKIKNKINKYDSERIKIPKQRKKKRRRERRNEKKVQRGRCK